MLRFIVDVIALKAIVNVIRNNLTFSSLVFTFAAMRAWRMWRANAFYLAACSLPLAARFLCSERDLRDAAAAIAVGRGESA